MAVEADWPDAYRVNRYARGASDGPDADRALAGFERSPPAGLGNHVEVLLRVERHAQAVAQTV